LPRSFRAGQAAFLFSVDHSLSLAMGAGFVVLLLGLALHNHRSAERSVARVWRQGIWIAGFLTVAVLLLTVVNVFLWTKPS
jgi:hypothetical protein